MVCQGLSWCFQESQEMFSYHSLMHSSLTRTFSASTALCLGTLTFFSGRPLPLQIRLAVVLHYRVLPVHGAATMASAPTELQCAPPGRPLYSPLCSWLCPSGLGYSARS